ncbi:hypothetical protein CMU14_13160 [Elizabethkingia anophelis]|nr:hypothetical protein [Elizabethkingia anophelis]
METGLVLMALGVIVLCLGRLLYLAEKVVDECKYEESELVDFGNFLLSKDRLESIESEENKRFVHDVDLRNWEDR